MLRTGSLALAALYAGRGFRSSWSPAVVVACFRELAVHLIDVHHGKDLRDVDTHGTAWRAVVTGGACNASKLQERLGGFIQHMVFFIAEWLEMAHNGQIVIHLLHV